MPLGAFGHAGLWQSVLVMLDERARDSNKS
jgi:hypothetical protein